MRSLFVVMISLAFIGPVNASDLMLHCIKEKHISYNVTMPDSMFLSGFKEFDNPARQLEPDANYYLKIKENKKGLQIIVTTPEQPGESWEYLSFGNNSFDYFVASRGASSITYDGEYLSYASTGLRGASIMMLKCRAIN